MGAAGRDESVVLGDGRTLEYWEGGDPHGRAVIWQPGTPVTRVLGRWGHDAAVAAGVRLIGLNRPGYGGSSLRPGAPSLLAVGRDTIELARLLRIPEFAVFGCSGGGPFAAATAVAGREAVRAVGLVGAIGPWRLLEGPDANPADRACLALQDSGDAAAAWDCMFAMAVEERGRLEPAEYRELIFRGEESSIVHDERYRRMWLENLRIVRENLGGYVYDNLAWGAEWDVDPGDATAPAFLFYGTGD
ncbi:MAG TPA: alpha/beta hydrolase, partial [Candidatus Limnocylindrales bacterium]|nr:alpha/beta hydrolase [Candidatus Limnocylindrales bacterium]